MNAQEALDELVAFAVWNGTILQQNGTTLKKQIDVLQQLIDQSNAKPKTLEELGWENTWFGDTVDYSNGLTHIYFYTNCFVCPTPYSRFTYEELLAIAENMKELGMTGEQIAKGETK